MQHKFWYHFLEHPACWILQSVLVISYIVVPHNIGLTHDSAMYAFGARTLVEANTLLDPSGNPMVLYPPLYPFLLSVGIRLGISISAWSVLLNVVAHSALILLLLQWTKTFTNKSIQYALLLMLVYGMPLVQNTVFMWADSIFITLLVGAVLLAQKAMDSNKVGWILVSSILSVCAILDRFIGVTIVVSICLQLLLATSLTLKRRLIWCLIFGGINVLFFSIWEYRNVQLAGVSNHLYEPGIASLSKNLAGVLFYFGSYWLPQNLPYWILVVIGLGWLITLSVLEFRNFRNTGKISRAFIFFNAGLMYAFIFSVMNTIWFICDWDDRYISPSFPFFMIATFYWLDKKLDGIFSSFFISMLVLILLVYPFGRYFKNAFQWRKTGIGFHNVEWQQNKLLKWVRANRGGVYISNNSMPIIIPGNKKCYYSPIQINHEVILVWWNKEFQLNYIEWEKSELEKWYEFSAGPEFPEGKIYFLKPFSKK